MVSSSTNEIAVERLNPQKAPHGSSTFPVLYVPEDDCTDIFQIEVVLWKY